jgi:hypothetical protein
MAPHAVLRVARKVSKLLDEQKVTHALADGLAISCPIWHAGLPVMAAEGLVCTKLGTGNWQDILDVIELLKLGDAPSVRIAPKDPPSLASAPRPFHDVRECHVQTSIQDTTEGPQGQGTKQAVRSLDEIGAVGARRALDTPGTCKCTF